MLYCFISCDKLVVSNCLLPYQILISNTSMAMGFSLSPSSLVLKEFSLGLSSEKRTRINNLFASNSPIHKLPSEATCRSSYLAGFSPFLKCSTTSRKTLTMIPRSSGSSSSGDSPDDSKTTDKGKVPFGYSRKDVLLIGVGVTALGVGLKSGLEFVGVDPLQAGNVVQLVLVLGLTIGWISTYIFRVSNKEMTYAQQLRDYESKVMEKRLEGLTEAELQVLLEQVEEEKSTLTKGKKVN